MEERKEGCETKETASSSPEDDFVKLKTLKRQLEFFDITVSCSG